MKKRLCVDRGLTYFWIVGFVLLFADHVRCFNDECPGGREPRLERWVLEKFMSWMPHELRNPDDICVSRVGAGSYLCRDQYNNNYSEICQCVWCLDPVLEVCRPLSSQDGIQCGDKKWCYEGKCHYSEQAVQVDDSCPFGDNKGYSQHGMSCQQLVPGNRKSCYDDVTRQMCCGSCATHASEEQGGCQYGDRIEGCQLDMCEFMSDLELDSCCQTCGYYTEIVPTRRPEVTVSPLVTVDIRTLTPRTTAQTTKTPTNIEITTKKLPDLPTSKSTSSSASASTSASTTPKDSFQTTTSTVPTVTTTPKDPIVTTKSTDPTATTTTTDPTQTTKNSTDPTETTSTTEPSATSTKATDPTQTTKNSTDPTQTTSTPTDPTATTPTNPTATTPTDPTATTPTDPTATTPTDPTATTPTDPTVSTNASETTPSTVSAPTVTSSVAGSGTTSTTTSEATSTTEQPTNTTGGSQEQNQDDGSNAVAIGTGAAVGGVAAMVTIATVTYVIIKRGIVPSNPSPGNNNAPDCDSIGGDSLTSLTHGMMGTSSRWYPGYASTHPMG